MWPFNLSGPAFLFVYLLLGVASLIAFLVMQTSREARGADRKRDASRKLTDPYAVAYLRGGADEAVRVAIMSLIDRGLLDEDDGKVFAKNHAQLEGVRRPIEKAVLQSAAKPTTVDAVLSAGAVKSACTTIEHELQKQDLRASERTFRERLPLFWGFVAILLGVALIRIAAALMSGRTNIGFLIVLAVAFFVFLWLIWRRKKTGLGWTVLIGLRQLFSGLKSRASTLRSGGASTEAVMLAAVFGLSALPAAEFPYVRRLFPAPASDGGGEGGSSHDSGSSCSSSCGGGGGCGGCGGG
jgi:uncharacterized protein (TIGR04222 family)